MNNEVISLFHNIFSHIFKTKICINTNNMILILNYFTISNWIFSMKPPTFVPILFVIFHAYHVSFTTATATETAKPVKEADWSEYLKGWFSSTTPSAPIAAVISAPPELQRESWWKFWGTETNCMKKSEKFQISGTNGDHFDCLSLQKLADSAVKYINTDELAKLDESIVYMVEAIKNDKRRTSTCFSWWKFWQRGSSNNSTAADSAKQLPDTDTGKDSWWWTRWSKTDSKSSTQGATNYDEEHTTGDRQDDRWWGRRAFDYIFHNKKTQRDQEGFIVENGYLIYPKTNISIPTKVIRTIVQNLKKLEKEVDASSFRITRILDSLSGMKDRIQNRNWTETLEYAYSLFRWIPEINIKSLSNISSHILYRWSVYWKIFHALLFQAFFYPTKNVNHRMSTGTIPLWQK